MYLTVHEQTNNSIGSKLFVHESIPEMIAFKHQELSINRELSTKTPEKKIDYGNKTKAESI